MDGNSKGLIRMYALDDALELAEIFEEHAILNDVDELYITFMADLLDAYGNSEPGSVVEVGFKAKTLSKINYKNAESKNIPDIADNYWEHPIFSDYTK